MRSAAGIDLWVGLNASNWLAPAFAGEVASGRASELRLWFDADQVEALAADREALWARVAAADFLTVNEKRAAVGYQPVGQMTAMRRCNEALTIKR